MLALSEGGLHQVNRRAAVEGMGSVRVPEPMRRDAEFDTGAGGSFAAMRSTARGCSMPPFCPLRERKTESPEPVAGVRRLVADLRAPLAVPLGCERRRFLS
jgi:hypothetical protein